MPRVDEDVVDLRGRRVWANAALRELGDRLPLAPRDTSAAHMAAALWWQ